MDIYERLEASASLRWTLRIWNTVCSLAAAAALVAAVVLFVWGGDGYLGDAIAMEFVAFALIAAVVVAAVWYVGRVALVALWGVALSLLRA